MESNNAAIVRRAPPMLAYAAGIGSVALVSVAGRLIQLDIGGVYLLYTAVVMFAVWLGGRGPGVVATVTAIIVGNYWVIGGSGWNLGPGAIVTAALFVAVSAVIIALSDDLLRTLGKLTALQLSTESDLAQFERERAARRHAEAASEAKDRLLAVVSHELRTPLTVLTGWLWTLKKDEAGQRTRAIDEIERNAQTLARLIDDLLDVARAMTGKLQLTVAPVTLPEVLNKASEVMVPAMSAKDIEFNLTTDADLPLIVGDADRLQQVFWNLLSNAVKFTPAGGRIDARVSRSGVNIVVSIADSGIGIPAEFLPHVFERFRQQDDSSTRQHGGLGLGLSIVRNIVELHGGTVDAASDGEGRGSRFTVALPVPAIAAASAAPQGTVPRLLDGVRILFVDDKLDARETVRAVLEQFGATVTTAGSVAEALVVLSAFTPDALLADIAMPGEDGFSLIGRLRSEGANRAIPAAALTAYGKEHRDKILQAGYQMYISKPVAPPELAGLVQQLAARSRMH